MGGKIDILLNDWYINSKNYLNSKKNLKNDEMNKVINEYLLEQIIELDIKRLIVYLDSNRLNDKVRVEVNTKKINPLTTHRYDVLSKHLRDLIEASNKSDLLYLVLKLFSLPNINTIFNNYVNGRYPNSAGVKLYGTSPISSIDDIDCKELQDVYRIAVIIHLIINKITGNDTVKYKVDLNVEVSDKLVKLSFRDSFLEISVLNEITIFKYNKLDNRFSGIVENLELDNSCNLSNINTDIYEFKSSIDHLSSNLNITKINKDISVRDNILSEKNNINTILLLKDYIGIIHDNLENLTKLIYLETDRMVKLKSISNNKDLETIDNFLSKFDEVINLIKTDIKENNIVNRNLGRNIINYEIAIGKRREYTDEEKSKRARKIIDEKNKNNSKMNKIRKRLNITGL